MTCFYMHNCVSTLEIGLNVSETYFTFNPIVPPVYGQEKLFWEKS